MKKGSAGGTSNGENEKEGERAAAKGEPLKKRRRKEIPGPDVSIQKNIASHTARTTATSASSSSTFNHSISSTPSTDDKYLNAVTVVDEHHDALLPILAQHAATPGRWAQGLKMLHFDSHPDIGVPNLTKFPGMAKAIFRHTASPAEVHECNEIETWVTPLLLAGLIDEVIWGCGHWCDQLPVGTFRLLIGYTESGEIKIAAAPGKQEKGCELVSFERDQKEKKTTFNY